MSKVILKGFILIPESEIELIKNELVNHQSLTLDESGCITFQITENINNPLRLDVYEEFTDKAAFEYHQKRVKASLWGKVTTNCQRHYEVFE
ncbi:putative quinol monooxygenase [Vibrio hepatarius]|uniref:putative quinol monooxygenase n=1 Tax=Vibrio hepatarius TaxID=171383 RepID=UPI001C08A969|nr:antibiotic biosynthesis monooxygenase [Vibrio hepatarius]